MKTNKHNTSRTSSNSAANLNVPTIAVPAQLFGAHTMPSVRLHPTMVKLIDHVDRHVLEPCARAALMSAHPQLAELDAFTCPIAAGHWAKRAQSGEHFSAVVTAYSHLVEASVREAVELGLVVRAAHSTITLDSAGMIVVIEGAIVRTAFIPGIEHDFDLPRHLDHRSRDTRRVQAALCEARDADQAYFFDVFRRAIQSIRRFPTENGAGRAEYGALKYVLPSNSALSYESWRGMRLNCGHAPMEFRS